jgi:hypothetical protein
VTAFTAQRAAEAIKEADDCAVRIDAAAKLDGVALEKVHSPAAAIYFWEEITNLITCFACKLHGIYLLTKKEPTIIDLCHEKGHIVCLAGNVLTGFLSI